MHMHRLFMLSIIDIFLFIVKVFCAYLLFQLAIFVVGCILALCVFAYMGVWV